MTIDYGEITVPTGWNEIKLKQYIDISRLYTEDKTPELIDMIPILINKDKDYVMSLPSEFLDKILEQLIFVVDEPDVKPTNEIVINGEKYIINYQEKLRVGEYLAADACIKDDDKDIAKLLAILCRKQGEVYDTDFTTNILNDRIKMYEEQPVTKVLPLFFFMLALYTILQSPSILSSNIKESISHIQKNIESLAKDGEISKHTFKSVMKTLKKSEKTINKILKNT